MIGLEDDPAWWGGEAGVATSQLRGLRVHEFRHIDAADEEDDAANDEGEDRGQISLCESGTIDAEDGQTDTGDEAEEADQSHPSDQLDLGGGLCHDDSLAVEALPPKRLLT